MRFGIVIGLAIGVAACGGDDGNGSDAPDAAAADAASGAVDAAVADGAVLVDAGPAAFLFDGSVVGPSVPGNAKVVVVWVVSVGNDYVYKYGEGASAGALFNVGLADATPPEQALNVSPQLNVKLGVGVPVLVSADLEIPDGAEVSESDILGIAGQHAIIYREGTFPNDPEVDWPNDFSEATYQCGKCVEAPTNQTFDSFEPVDCGSVVIDTDPADICNWT